LRKINRAKNEAMSDAKTEASETRPATSDDPWAEATEAYLTAATTFAETLQACWMAGANAAIGSLQSGLDALPKTDATSAAAKPSGSTGRYANTSTNSANPRPQSWYRPPVENPFLSLFDDMMKPWRTLVPDHSGHPQHLSEANVFTPKGAAEILAAYQTGSGFTMAQISFPDEKSVSVTMPAPWAFLSPR
jgi:hypothetical protein